jgi:phosphonate transport system substrate-binding protein
VGHHSARVDLIKKKNTMAWVGERKLAIGVTAYIISSSVHAACLGVVSSQVPLKVYIVPQLTATQTYTHWAPLLEQVGQQTNQCFELFVPTSIPHFESDLNDGLPDFAFMNPYHAVMTWRESKYVPLVASSEPIYGVLSVSRGSKIQKIQDLKGRKIAFPAPNAFAASLLIRATLSQEDVPYTSVYLNTHSNVYRAVIRGDVAAGGGIHSTLLAEPAELNAELSVLMETKRYTAHPFSANARVPVALQQQIQDAFLEIGQTNAGRKLLNDVQLAEPKAVTFAVNYQPLEALQLDKFVMRNAN